MPLSEEELRVLEQMERALVADDPKLASTLRGTSTHRRARSRVIAGGAVLVVGIALLIGAVLATQPVLGVVGFVVMLGGAILALTALRAPEPTREETAHASVRETSRGLGVVDGGRKHRPARQSRAGTPFMSRMEERWRRRREGGL